MVSDTFRIAFWDRRSDAEPVTFRGIDRRSVLGLVAAPLTDETITDIRVERELESEECPPA